ncbi:MAG: fibronectin type III domain-containing protein [Candidatus Manganitrophus sp.]|nr:fibronectin type III domain-containing protein [Candidatus Manganitrophus sp.]WDT73241.1 MAG: fibronectin type III domain-containing protein [Candidatus Manganitrophus sp.]WDT79209.1 MAG: fibronectin type III domain-containing protein [Candidatus Manganitrophus sp.]
MKRFFSILMILIGTMGTASIGWALDWYMVLNFSIPDPFATNGALQSRLILGVDPAADDNFNHQWDTIAFPTGPLQATFPHPEYPSHPDYIAGSEWLWQDIRSNDQPSHTWDIDVSSDRAGANIILSWTFKTADNLCQRPVVRLIDATRGVTTEISPGGGSYAFPNGDQPTRLVVDFMEGASAPPPPPPTNLWSPRQGKESILLSWSSLIGSDLLGYHLFRRASGQTAYTQITSQPVTSLSFLDGNLSPGETYFYKVTAVNSDGCSSGDSNEISVALN